MREYGKWTQEELMELIQQRVVVTPLRPTAQQRIAMQIAKETGANYNWLLQRLEDYGVPVRFA